MKFKKSQAKTLLIMFAVLIVLSFSIFAISVQLKSPATGTYDIDGIVTLSCNASPTASWNITNVTIYHNITGTWGANITNTTKGDLNTVENRSFILSGIPDGNYNWGCLSYELNASLNRTSAWSATNRSFIIDTVAPNVALNTPAADAYILNDTVNFTAVIGSDVNPDACTLWENFGGTWKQNRTITYAAITQNFTIPDLPDGQYTWNVQCNDSAGNKGNGVNRTVNVAWPPVVVLGGPADNYNQSNRTGDVQVTVSSDYTSTPDYLCYVWSNATGTWSQDPLSRTVLNNTATTYKHQFQGEGAIKWTFRCNENTDQNIGAFGSTNRTINIDQTAPTVTLNAPTTDSWSTSSSVVFNYTGTDSFLKNCTIYEDFDGAWRANVTNATGLVSGGPVSPTIVLNDNSSGYTWGASCVDHSGNVGWATNRTIKVDTNTPGIYNLSNVSISSCDNINMTWQSEETVNGSINYGLTTALGTAATSSLSFIQTHGALLDFGLNVETSYNFNVTSCDQAGNCNVSAYSTTTPLSVCEGWSVYGILESMINLSKIATDSGAEFVYWFNQTAQDYVAYTAGATLNANITVNSSACVFLSEETNSTWWRNNTDTNNYNYSIYGEGDNFISVPSGFNFGNLTDSFLNSSDGTAISGVNSTPDYYAIFNNSWDGNPDGVYTSHLRNTTYNNLTAFNRNTCFWTYGVNNVTWDMNERDIS